MKWKKIGKLFTSKFVGTGPSSYKNIIYRAAVSQRLRNTSVEPRNTISKATSQWIAMWQQVALKLLKNYAKHFGLRGVWRKNMKMNKRWCWASPRLTKLYKKLSVFLSAKWKRRGPWKHFKTRKVVFSIEAKFREEAKNNVRLFC